MTANRSHLGVRDVADLAWQRSAVCRAGGVEFFPENGSHTTAAAAKRLCVTCPVRDACLDYALAHADRFGIWGGTTEKERRDIARERRHRRSAASAGVTS